MNDYLSNIVARSLSRMEMIVPRLASRYEPLDQAESLDLRGSLIRVDIDWRTPSEQRNGNPILYPFESEVGAPFLASKLSRRHSVPSVFRSPMERQPGIKAHRERMLYRQDATADIDAKKPPAPSLTRMTAAPPNGHTNEANTSVIGWIDRGPYRSLKDRVSSRPPDFEARSNGPTSPSISIGHGNAQVFTPPRPHHRNAMGRFSKDLASVLDLSEINAQKALGQSLTGMPASSLNGGMYDTNASANGWTNKGSSRSFKDEVSSSSPDFEAHGIRSTRPSISTSQRSSNPVTSPNQSNHRGKPSAKPYLGARLFTPPCEDTGEELSHCKIIAPAELLFEGQSKVLQERISSAKSGPQMKVAPGSIPRTSSPPDDGDIIGKQRKLDPHEERALERMNIIEMRTFMERESRRSFAPYSEEQPASQPLVNDAPSKRHAFARGVVYQPRVSSIPKAMDMVEEKRGPSSETEATPEIQVTIGRIEVRATPPPANPPRRQRASPPLLSLDEYLHQRAGGDGR